MDQAKGSPKDGTGTPVDSDSENPSSYNKVKYHSSKMDLNLRILRDQMSNLKDTGDSLSRQMASMYRSFQKVKDEDTVSGGDESDDDYESGDDNMAGRSCVDTEDDVNQMTDLDADESSISSRRGPLKTVPPKGQLANLQRKKATQNGRDPPSKNMNNRGKDSQRSQQTSQKSSNANSKDRNANEVSSDLTTTTSTRRKDVTQSGMEGDAEESGSGSDDDTLSSSECSGNCLCCSSIASYQGIPWTIRRPSSAETTEYSDSSECSDYEDDSYGPRKTPLYARLSPFFYQECSHSEDSNSVDGDAEDEGESMPVKRMSPLGCESPNKTDALPEIGKEGKPKTKDSKPKAPAKGAAGGAPKVPAKPSAKPAVAAGKDQKPLELKVPGKPAPSKPAPSKPAPSKPVPSKPGPKETKKESSKDVSPSQAVGLGAVAKNDKSSSAAPPKKTTEESTEPGKQKARHVSKTAIVLLDPEAEFKDGDTIRKKSNFLPSQQAIEVPLSYVDKNGRITLTPDPKLAPEAFKAGKTITFKVRSSPETTAKGPDGSVVFSPNPGSKSKVGRTILRVSSTDSPPLSLNAEEIGHEHQIQVSPEGVIRLSKRKPVPMQIFMPQPQTQPMQQQSATIRVTGGNTGGHGGTQGEHDSCPHCHRKANPTVIRQQQQQQQLYQQQQQLYQQQQQQQQPSSVANNVRVVRMSPGITPSPVQSNTTRVVTQQSTEPSQNEAIRLISVTPTSGGPPQGSRVQVIQRQDSGQFSPPSSRQHIVVHQDQTPRSPSPRPGQHVIIQRQDSGQQLRYQIPADQGYQPQVYQQGGYPQEVYQQQQPYQQVYTQQGYPQQGYQQIVTNTVPQQPGGVTTIRLGGGVQIPVQPGQTRTIQHQVVQPTPPSNGQGITTIRFGDGAPIKVQPGQGMRFVINPK